MSGKNGRRYALRFRAYGARHYLTLGGKRDGWSKKRAEAELARIMRDVRREVWKPTSRCGTDTQTARATSLKVWRVRRVLA